MAVVIAPQLAAADLLCCLGLGFFLAVCGDLMRLFFGQSRWERFLCDNLMFAGGAVLLYSFAAGRSNSGQVRWYMAAALALGVWGYSSVIAPGTAAARRLVKWLLERPFLVLYLAAFLPALRCFAGLWRGMTRKMEKTARKRRKKQLKKQAEVLYNSIT